jgi:phosphohistidine phosphatase
LTRAGESKMFEIARGLRNLGLAFDLVLTSPYIRAFRTAEILGEVFESKKVFETKNLVPGADPEAVIDEINGNFSALKEIVMVGHEPFMSSLISVLLCGNKNMAIDLRKGGCCQLTVERLSFGQCACLDWLMTPRQMTRLRRGQ